MRRIAGLFVFCLIAAVVPFAVNAPADAQAGIFVTPAAEAIASDIVNGTVVRTINVQFGDTPQRVSEIEVSSTLKGSLSGSILVEVPGGQRADGAMVFVSHTPELTEGEQVQLALVPAANGQLLSQAVAPELVAFSVANGIEGAYGLLPDGVGRANAVGDFSLTGAHFASFAPAVEFRVNPANSGLGENDTIEGVRRAFDMWEADNGSDVDFTYGGTSGKVGVNLSDDQNTVSWVTTSAGWLAQANWISSHDGKIMEFDVQVNRSFSWANGAQPGRFDIGTVVGHEVGHGIGFAHTSASEELMFFQIQSGGTKGLGPGDRSGAAHLYPASNPSPEEPDTPDDPGPSDGSLCAGEAITVDLNTDEGTVTDGPDVILGTPGDDDIDGLGGDDVICGGGGADVIQGGGGNDVIHGQDGDDKLFGGPGDDEIRGGTGDDVIHGNRGEDMLMGDDGNDRMFGYADNDQMWGGEGADAMHGNRGDDQLMGGDGDDRMFGYTHDDQLDGGNGDDLVVGNFGDDTLSGQDGDDRMWGSHGTDFLFGGDDRDQLNGNSGTDHLDGGPGSDFLDGGIERDHCNGAGQLDTAVRCESMISVP